MIWGTRATLAWTGATKLLRKGLGALKFALGPVGIAIMGIGWAASWLIDNWSDVAPYFGRVWEWICGKFQWAVDKIKGMLKWISDSITYVKDALNFFGDDEEEAAKQKKAPGPLPQSPSDAVGPKQPEKALEKPAGPKLDDERYV